jgi:hypothetical protein
VKWFIRSLLDEPTPCPRKDSPFGLSEAGWNGQDLRQTVQRDLSLPVVWSEAGGPIEKNVETFFE